MKQGTPSGSSERQRKAIVLAGGLSLRYGEDKVFAKWGDRTLLQICVEKLRASYFEPCISLADAKEIPCKDVRIMKDLYPFEGPLQALYSTYLQLQEEKVFVVACDMPFFLAPAVEKLWKSSGTADISVFEFEGLLFPLPGIYSRNILPHAKRLLDDGRRDLRGLLKSPLELAILPWEEWRSLDPEAKTLANINTEAKLMEVNLWN